MSVTSRSSRSSRRAKGSSAKAHADLAGGRLLEDCRGAWSIVCAPKSRHVTRKQLLNAVHLMGLNPSRKAMSEFCGSNQKFTFDDLRALAESLPPLSVKDLVAAFKLIDEDGSGSLSLDELSQMLTTYGERMTEDEVKGVMEEFDANKDGQIDFDEFSDIIVALGESTKKKRPKVRKRQGESVTSALADETQAIESKEPSNLQNWDGDRLFGTFLAEEDNVASSQHYIFTLTKPTEVFLSLRIIRGGLIDTVDATILVIETDPEGKWKRLVGSSPTQYNHDAQLRLRLNAGDYVVVPWTTSCTLQKRKRQPAQSVPLSTRDKNGDLVLSNEAREMLREVFSRIDLDMRGTIGREEYDLFVMQTDGEPADDETWDFMVNTFSVQDGELTFKGFCEMYTQVLQATEGNEDEFYESFSGLGYNRALELDEACNFVLFVFTQKAGALESFDGLSFDQKRLERAALESVLQKGTRETIEDGIVMVTDRSSMRVSFAAINERSTEAAVTFDCSKSRNARSHRGADAMVTTVVIPAGRAGLAHHLMPADMSRDWNVSCTLSISN